MTTSAPAIPAAEIVQLLRRIIAGDSQIKLTSSRWYAVQCGNVDFEVDGWQLVFFNDCNDLDYLDSAVAPDGRRAEFDDWFDVDARDPLDALSIMDRDALERILEDARSSAPPRPAGPTRQRRPPQNLTLARIPGNFISQGMRDLPPAGPGAPEQTVEIDCGAWGCWAITYRPHRDPRWRNWFWVAARAEETGAGLS